MGAAARAFRWNLRVAMNARRSRPRLDVNATVRNDAIFRATIIEVSIL